MGHIQTQLHWFDIRNSGRRVPVLRTRDLHLPERCTAQKPSSISHVWGDSKRHGSREHARPLAEQHSPIQSAPISCLSDQTSIGTPSVILTRTVPSSRKRVSSWKASSSLSVVRSLANLERRFQGVWPLMVVAWKSVSRSKPAPEAMTINAISLGIE